ncbi:MAG: aminotransferase class V-fold PLP-dependent enzyme [Clostridia bacterium]|nr:aminotransferase class V-fold PLP-dependent enzyme [Lachnospiraceae bacterium]NCB99845.1 aminotransferase class V-fold PLP-dependent enzyme [Clostridia bacterium]NCD02784.1 aminotransferase class V-fold PLP-dependent enzyme [Clostridia bacterium]
MDKINVDQLKKTWPKAEGVEEAMTAGGSDSIVEETREQLCRLFEGSKKENVVFTETMDEALSKTIKALFKGGDHVLVSSLENDAVTKTLDEIQKTGVEYTMIPCNEKGQLILYDPGKDKDVFAAVEALLQPNTKGLIINHASEVCGSVLQAKELCEFAKKHNLLFVLNAAQTAGYVPIYMKQWGVDVLTFSGRYGLLGPEEANGFIASERAAEIFGGGNWQEQFETKNPDKKAIAGLHKALEFVINKKIQFLCGNGHKMAEYFIRKVQHISGVHIIGPGYKDRVPIVSIQTDFMTEKDVEEKLLKDWGIVATSGCHGAEAAHKALGTWPRGTLRFAFGYFNTIAQMDKLVQAMWQMTVQTDILPSGSNMPKE